MNKNIEQIMAHPLMVILISFLAILLILSLQENKQKALLSSENLEQNQENIKLLKDTVNKKEEFFNQAQNDLYKEKLIRNELVQNKEGETVIQIPATNLELVETKETTLDKVDYRVQNWKEWWLLLTKK